MKDVLELESSTLMKIDTTTDGQVKGPTTLKPETFNNNYDSDYEYDYSNDVPTTNPIETLRNLTFAISHTMSELLTDQKKNTLKIVFEKIEKSLDTDDSISKTLKKTSNLPSDKQECLVNPIEHLREADEICPQILSSKQRFIRFSPGFPGKGFGFTATRKPFRKTGS